MKSCEAVTPLGKDSPTPSTGSVSPPNPPTPKDLNDVPSDDLDSPGISMETTEKGLTLNICPSTVTVAPAAFAEPPPVQRVAPKKSLPKFKSKSYGHKSCKSEAKNKPTVRLIPLAIPVTREDPRFSFVGAPSAVLANFPTLCLRKFNLEARKSEGSNTQYMFQECLTMIKKTEKAILPNGVAYELSTHWVKDMD